MLFLLFRGYQDSLNLPKLHMRPLKFAEIQYKQIALQKYKYKYSHAIPAWNKHIISAGTKNYKHQYTKKAMYKNITNTGTKNKNISIIKNIRTKR